MCVYKRDLPIRHWERLTHRNERRNPRLRAKGRAIFCISLILVTTILYVGTGRGRRRRVVGLYKVTSLMLNPTNQKNWPSVGTIASTLAQYSAIYGNTLGQFSWFVGQVALEYNESFSNFNVVS